MHQSQDEPYSQLPAQDEAQITSEPQQRPVTFGGLEQDSKSLDDIKFSLQVIMRELQFLSSIPAFKTLQENLKSRSSNPTFTERKPEISDQRILLNEAPPFVAEDQDSTSSTPSSGDSTTYESSQPDVSSITQEPASGEATIEDIMSKVSNMLNELSNLMEPKASETSPVSYPVPEVQLAPPFGRLQTAPFATILDNYWLKDDYRTPEASQKILVAISPVLRHTSASVSRVQRRSKRAAGWPFIPAIDPRALNDELMSKTLFRREISNENGYNYDKPTINFEASATKQEYLPPLEPASANNINSLLQPFDKETGYEYKRPEKIFELPSSTARVVVTTQRPTTQRVVTRPSTTTRLTTTTQRPRTSTQARIVSTSEQNEYLPPREPAASNVEETGYKYPRPEINFPLQPSASNGIQSTVRPTVAITPRKPRPTEQTTARPTEPTTARPTRTTGYSYPRPAIKFEASASNQEYLPPLEPAPANNINSLLQPFDKETGYNYKRPEKIFELPTSSIRFASSTQKLVNLPVSTTVRTTPVTTRMTTTPRTTTTRFTTTRRPITTAARLKSTFASNEINEYLPPREPAASNIEDVGYKYPRPSVNFPLKPSASNTISSTIRPAERTTTRTTRVTTTTRKTPLLVASNSDGGLETFDYPKQKFDPENGYDYTRPKKPFELPLDTSNTNESPAFEYPQQPFNEETGYEYAKPSIKFEIANDYLPPNSRLRESRELESTISVNDRLNPLTRLSSDLKKLTSAVQ